MTKNFFKEMTEASKVKTEIVLKYFDAWSKIMKNKADRLAYIDLYSGRGKYEDDTKSTPLLILEYIIADPILCNKVVTIFNDANPEFVDILKNEIDKLPGVDRLKYKPVVNNTVVGEELASLFEKHSLVPTFSFIDPWGYKGLSAKLIGSLIKDWGSDCIFYFNYNRINAGINNRLVEEHMNSIFGADRVKQLRQKLQGLTPEERELTIINELAEYLSENRTNYVLPFRFIDEDGRRTSHYLIFISKHVLGYKIMKDIMWKCSSEHRDGVASFSYIPANHQYSLLSLYSYKTIEDLMEELINSFAGKTMTVEEIFESHHVNTTFVLRNYQDALLRLEEQNRIITDPPASKRRKIKGKLTLGKNVKITFPPR